jgi:hypothetical protein
LSIELDLQSWDSCAQLYLLVETPKLPPPAFDTDVGVLVLTGAFAAVIVLAVATIVFSVLPFIFVVPADDGFSVVADAPAVDGISTIADVPTVVGISVVAMPSLLSLAFLLLLVFMLLLASCRSWYP